jgi:hypothetical protein
MPMREDCKHFQSRTYDDGEVSRFCELDLAPEQPWRCPDPCPGYEKRLADVYWEHGSLVRPTVEAEPKEAMSDGELDEEALGVLEEAEEAVDLVADEEIEAYREQEERAGDMDERERERLEQEGGQKGQGHHFWHHRRS